MRTTADARTLFREIDGTELQEAGSYTFKVLDEAGPATIVGEGQEVPREDTDIREHTVKFVGYKDNEHRKQLATEALREGASAHLAGSPLDEVYDHKVLFIDREDSNAYLVDASKFGYEVVSDKDEFGNPIEGGFVGIMSGAALRVR